MINRELIRLKTVQVVYAHYMNGKEWTLQNAEAADRELFFSLDKSYELYNALLMLMQEVHRVATEEVEQRRLRARQLGEDETINDKFIRNAFMQVLSQNKQLIDFRDGHNQFWALEEELAKTLLRKIQHSIVYQEYMKDLETSFEADREVWRSLYKRFFCNNDEIDNALEDMSLYWNDDKYIIDTFVMKTIKRTQPMELGGAELLPKYAVEADRQFASDLIRYAVGNGEQYRAIIGQNLRNWDFSRVAQMDLVIMQVALAEIISFPDIPLSVSINEYVNVAKAYSTPRSGSYINGMLDGIARKLLEDGTLVGKSLPKGE